MLSHVDGYMLMHNNGSNIDENSNSHSIADGPKTYKHTSHDNAIAAMIGVRSGERRLGPFQEAGPAELDPRGCIFRVPDGAGVPDQGSLFVFRGGVACLGLCHCLSVF